MPIVSEGRLKLKLNLMKQIYPENVKPTNTLHSSQPKWYKGFTVLILALTVSCVSFAGTANADTTVVPELVFVNPVLVSGTANNEGAIYRFANVTKGVDAEIKLKKFSRPDIVMTNIDLPALGWDKAFQPQFGIPGLVQANQSWHIDFECAFFEAGKTKKQKISRFDLTSLDVDGDGVTISEFVQMEKPKSVAYSSLTSLISGIADPEIECGECSKTSALHVCSNCAGTGKNGSASCGNCKGSGKLHNDCGHAWDGSTNAMVQGTVLNFVNIDTAATQVMATYTYLDKDKINFRIGAKTGNRSSNGAGIRLNSLWFRSFDLAPQYSVLPVTLLDFSAVAGSDKVLLNWTTAQEKQFSHFAIEKSFDGKNFEVISVVLNNNSSDKRKDYTYTDAGTNRGTVYYRLKMVDADQNTSFSAIRTLRMELQQDLVLHTYPNPTVNELRITVPAAWQNNFISMTVYNQSGQVVKHISKAKAGQIETIAINDLHAGIFLIKAASATEQVVKQFVKAK